MRGVFRAIGQTEDLPERLEFLEWCQEGLREVENGLLDEFPEKNLLLMRRLADRPEHLSCDEDPRLRNR